jgi:hypothetical protein
MKTVASFKLGPWSKPQPAPAPAPLADWADRAIFDALNTSARCGGVWVTHGSALEDAIKAAHQIAAGRHTGSVKEKS